jgi:hypothetical protein
MGKKSAVSEETKTENSSDACAMDAVMITATSEFPRQCTSLDNGEIVASSLMGGNCLSSSSSKATASLCSSLPISAIVDGENAMFPDNLLSCTTSGQDSPPSSREPCDSSSARPGAGEEGDGPADPSATEAEREAGGDETSRDLGGVSRGVEKRFRQGWSVHSAHDDNPTIAELFLMFGKNGTLRLEYEWCERPPTVAECLTTKLTNMLRRLVHLSTLEFTDFSKVRGGAGEGKRYVWKGGRKREIGGVVYS